MNWKCDIIKLLKTVSIYISCKIIQMEKKMPVG